MKLFKILCLLISFVWVSHARAAAPDLNAKLLDAVQFMDSESVKYLLSKGADPNFNNKDRSLLCWAAQNGSVDIVNQLIAAKGDLNAVDTIGHTPLMRAIDTQQIKVIEAILAAKPDLTIKTRDGKSVAIMSVESGKPEIVSMLLKAGADFNQTDPEGNSPALIAAQANNSQSIEIVKMLGAAKVNLNLSNIIYTPLVYAIEQENIEMVKALLDSGADVNALTESNQSPLGAALSRSSKEIAKLLLAHKANPNVSSNMGETPLFTAIDLGDPEIVEELVKAGADLNNKTASGQTPQEYAESSNKKDIAVILNTKN